MTSMILNNSGSITFGDGTVQTTKTPTNVSAFTNDSGWVTSSSLASSYAAKSTTAYSIAGGASRRLSLSFYTMTGVNTSGISANCNCNC